MKECAWCRNFFEPNSNRQKHCPACLADPDVVRERARRRKAAQRDREKKSRAGRMPTPKSRGEEKRCPSCRRRFTPTGNRQIWCGDCRKEARREYLAWYMRKWRARAALKKQVPGVNT